MFLSIIVPAFNVEAYIEKCLNSLLCQDLNKEDYEIIVVNDGSTDGTKELVDSLAKNESNIILINQDNQGLSGARNTGVLEAKGEYVMYVDSDDYIESNVLELLLQKIKEEKLDVLRFNYRNVDESGFEIPFKKNDKLYVDYSEDVVDGTSFLTGRLGIACYAWQFIIRAEIAKNVFFKQGIYFEDTEWTPRMQSEAIKVSSVNTIVYNYLKRTDSISHAVDDKKKRKVIFDKMSLIDELKSQSIEKKDKRWYKGMISHTVLSLMEHITADYYAERNFYISELRKKEIFPLSFYHCSFRKKVKITIVNISPLLYCLLIKR